MVLVVRVEGTINEATCSCMWLLYSGEYAIRDMSLPVDRLRVHVCIG